MVAGGQSVMTGVWQNDRCQTKTDPAIHTPLSWTEPALTQPTNVNAIRMPDGLSLAETFSLLTTTELSLA